jgi:hypothetical protein
MSKGGDTFPTRPRWARLDSSPPSTKQARARARALCEGAVFFACVACLLEHQHPVLFVAMVLLLMIVYHIPTLSGPESSRASESTTIQQIPRLP